jgi:AraC-like DNA-binding protein
MTTERSTGWLAGLRDRHVGRVLALLHEQPASAWSLDDLSRRAGLSRSALYERFVGTPPAAWRRMQAERAAS